MSTPSKLFAASSKATAWPSVTHSSICTNRCASKPRDFSFLSAMPAAEVLFNWGVGLSDSFLPATPGSG